MELNPNNYHGIVSIHTPVKGATRDNNFRNRLYRVSIHTPVKGATTQINIKTLVYQFQSTRP